MINIKVESPPILKGETAEKLTQVVSYLYRLSENLNVALNNLDTGSYAEAVTVVQSGAPSSGFTPQQEASLTELRALIVNTAEYVKTEEDRLSKELESHYEAISSEWGAYRADISKTVVETAEATVETYNFQSQIDAIDHRTGDVETYQQTTEGFIRSGFIERDPDTDEPIIGIAIGKNLQSTTEDGQTKFDPTQSCAFYTSDKVSFRLNGSEVAWISNQELHITNATIDNTLTIGNWRIDHANGFTIRWVG